jgi:hypothetical protein
MSIPKTIYCEHISSGPSKATEYVCTEVAEGFYPFAEYRLVESCQWVKHDQMSFDTGCSKDYLMDEYGVSDEPIFCPYCGNKTEIAEANL